MLDECVSDASYRPYVKPGDALRTLLERPESPQSSHDNNETSNLALLVSSLQELTTVVARQGEEIRELKDEALGNAKREARIRDTCTALNDAGRAEVDRVADALRRVESRLTALDRRLSLLEDHASNEHDIAQTGLNSSFYVNQEHPDETTQFSWSQSVLLSADVAATDNFASRHHDTSNAYPDAYGRLQIN